LEVNHVECYIFNTGDMMGKKIPKEVTLGSLEKIIEKKAEFKPFGNIDKFEYLPVEGFIPDFSDPGYSEQLAKRMLDRVAFIEECALVKGGFDKLPDEGSRGDEEGCRAGGEIALGNIFHKGAAPKIISFRRSPIVQAMFRQGPIFILQRLTHSAPLPTPIASSRARAVFLSRQALRRAWPPILFCRFPSRFRKAFSSSLRREAALSE
jgi:hypothetical protein